MREEHSSRSSMPDAPADQASATTNSAVAESSTRASMHRSPPSNRVPRSGPALVATLLSASLAVLLLPGCYYAHLASGQLRLVLASLSIAFWGRNNNSPARVRNESSVPSSMLRTMTWAS